jgi:alpha-1,3/alpha-1,6-mannosyltransferase
LFSADTNDLTMANSSSSVGLKPSSLSSNDRAVKHVVFIHLDLGIGGAEQLVLQLATASQDLGYSVDLVTTRCDQDHCFSSVKLPEGRLSRQVYIYGRWIPPNILGVATALMSTVRMFYLTWQVTRKHRSADVVVVDVLPTSLPLLLSFLPTAGILFYCHFPDKLLLQNQGGTAKRLYRKLLDAMEESTMGLSDTLVVNSKFTLGQVQEHFASLAQRSISVLYPALDTSNMVQSNQEPKTIDSTIVSLNRFERKKNIGLLIKAYAYVQKMYSSNKLPKLIIAGGYDTQSVENVQYRGELQQLKEDLGVQVDFRLDISDEERATLFQTALCVVYTPDKEHFGIVPLEAMYAGTPVLAVNSGGPTETVLDNITGLLRDPTPEAFGEALFSLISSPEKATTMGRAGRRHVEETFGTNRFEKEWKQLVEETKERRVKTRGGKTMILWVNTTTYLIEALLAFFVTILLTWFLRQTGVLKPTQSLLGAVRTGLVGDEL